NGRTCPQRRRSRRTIRCSSAQLLAQGPQFRRQLRIHRLLLWSRRPTLRHVLTLESRCLRRRRQPDQGIGALLWRARKWLREHVDEIQQRTLIGAKAAEPRANHSRLETIRCRRSPRQAALKFFREQYVGEL